MNLIRVKSFCWHALRATTILSPPFLMPGYGPSYLTQHKRQTPLVLVHTHLHAQACVTMPKSMQTKQNSQEINHTYITFLIITFWNKFA